MRKKIAITILSLCLLSLGSYAYISHYDKKEIPKKVNTNLNSSELKKYEDRRNSLLKENLSLYDIGDRYDILWNQALKGEEGLVSYVNKKYPNLSDTDKLKKQVSVLEYLNRTRTQVDFSGEFLNVVFKEAQLSDYLIKNHKNGDISNKNNIEILATNFDDLSNKSDYNRKELINFLIQIITANLSANDIEKLTNNEKIPIDVRNAIKKNNPQPVPQN